MDLSDPTRAVTSSLDGPVLAALASMGKPMTVGEIARQTVRGSEIGVRRSLARLVEQGIVRATPMGRNAVHELNRDHVAAGIAVMLAGLRLELWRRFREEIDGWAIKPLYASVFGSAARGDGNESSDIDLLLVRPTAADERSESWEQQLDELRDRVRSWTGNTLQVVDVDESEWRTLQASGSALATNVRKDGVELRHGKSLGLRQARRRA